jgi:hypothetical protein
MIVKSSGGHKLGALHTHISVCAARLASGLACLLCCTGLVLLDILHQSAPTVAARLGIERPPTRRVLTDLPYTRNAAAMLQVATCELQMLGLSCPWDARSLVELSSSC